MDNPIYISYARLSKDDGSRYASIKQQHNINTRYIREQLNWSGEIHYFSDDNVSGYFFDRPEFNNVIKLIQENNGNAILVTCESSRFGRNEAEVLTYWDDLHEMGVRIIFISENIDSYINPDIRDILGIYAWKDEQHVRAASKSVTAKFRERQLRGDLIIKVPFGYIMKTEEIKDSKGRIIGKNFIIEIDEKTAPIVEEIFELYINGYGYRKIADIMNEKGYPTPSLYTNRENASPIWSNQAVCNILKNDFYIGTLTCMKTFKRSVKGKSYITPKEQRIVHENHHEPLISKETFELVKKIMNDRNNTKTRGTKGRYIHLFSNKIFCGKCNKTYICAKYYYSNKKKNLKPRYICGTKFKFGTNYCSNINIKEDDLKEILLTHIKTKIKENNNLLEVLRKNIKDNNNDEEIEKKINRISTDIKKIKIDIKNLMRDKLKAERENKSTSLIEIYQEELDNMINKLNFLEQEIAKTTELKNNNINQEDLLEKQNKILEKFLHRDLTKKDIEILIDKIIIDDRKEQCIEIIFNVI